jgi:hypothetical protein
MTVSDAELAALIAGLGGGTVATQAPAGPSCQHFDGTTYCGAVDGVRRYLTGYCCPAHTPTAVAELKREPVTAAELEQTEDPAPQGDRVVYAPTVPATNAEPPSTVAELRDVLIGYDSSRPRSMQTRLGPSELGTPCQQQIARKLAGAPRRPVTAPVWAPFQGSAVHAEMEKVIAYWNEQLGRQRWLAEDELAIDDEIRGHGDAYDLDWDTVVDWKHVGATALKKLRAARQAGKPPAEQVSPEYRVQGHLYGVGHERKGRPVKRVRLVLLARSWQYDDSDEWTEEWRPEVAFRALDRYYATQDLLNVLDVASDPELITAVPATPSPDACKWCPFYRPGQPSGWAGCQGEDQTFGRMAAGLIIPTP